MKITIKIMEEIVKYSKTYISEEEATQSAEALIGYLSQSYSGKWIINYFFELRASEKQKFIENMQKILPYVINKEQFVSKIKYSMIDDLCESLPVDCVMNDAMAHCEEEKILSKEGYDKFDAIFQKEISDAFEEMIYELNPC